MVAKYRKKPVVVEAVQFTGNNWVEITSFCRTAYFDAGEVVIPTLEGKMRSQSGDWIIKGVKGEFYPCKPDIFEQIYEKIN